MVREFINVAVSRVGLDRCLRRHGVSDLKSLQPELEGQAKPLKIFKDHEPGCLHVAIDRAKPGDEDGGCATW